MTYTTAAYSLLDDRTRASVAAYFEAEPAALTVTLESRSLVGELYGLTIVGRDGSARYFEASAEMAAAAYAERKAEELAK